MRLVRGATVSGAVTGIDGPLDATTTVTLFWRTSPATFKIPASFDAASQTWQVSDVPPGSYSSWSIHPTAGPRSNGEG
ncbi:hypothetical protein GCM10025881_00060 [Pseudolysinimonas kribbensis]|uniref:Uncharacterized protein n=1 Tax=Pseudolysinimonas kribbensis TaxID=433641 RepID=A0ABQ6K2Q0_9MICO|nr:hypothetical protein [Pseudolysinimonas kribbensis]GMA93182.1 hypothetical protein GCM10025881_00060 [Pseudolysinimonas kribbensis]